jgi:hypothetical protein
VGGQALEISGAILNVPAPTGDGHPLTSDTEWLGGKRDAKWLCDQLGPNVELYLAGDFDSTPNTAYAFLQRPDGRVIMMDFLRTIVGPANEIAQKLAVPVHVSGMTLNVMHPLLCLESRLANVAVIPAKRTPNGVTQAQWGIQIANAYLLKIAMDGDLRQTNKACHRIASIAQSRHARYCYENYGTDPMHAVCEKVVNAIDGRFKNDDWRHVKQMIDKKRSKWRALGLANSNTVNAD